MAAALLKVMTVMRRIEKESPGFSVSLIVFGFVILFFFLLLWSASSNTLLLSGSVVNAAKRFQRSSSWSGIGTRRADPPAEDTSSNSLFASNTTHSHVYSFGLASKPIVNPTNHQKKIKKKHL